MNHPRAHQAYFNYIGYDSGSGQAEDLTNFSMDFDLIEVFNGTNWEQLDKTLPDWYSFLKRGKRATAIGNSDNHDAVRGVVGYPRNFVFVDEDVPGKVDDKEYINAIKAQGVVVSNGPFIDFYIGEAGMGETIIDTDGKVTIDLRVQAPVWMGAMEAIEIIGNGELVDKIALNGGYVDTNNPVIRYDGEIQVEAERDTWYIVKVYGQNDMTPVAGGTKPMAFTNPIYIDVDGNGLFDSLY